MHVILTVDDSPSMRKMVSFTLTGAGYKVIEAVDGVDALEKAQAHPFALVLADQNMPARWHWADQKTTRRPAL